MFHIMGSQVRSLPFGSSCHNGCIFQVDNLCGFTDFCFGRVGEKGRKDIGKNHEVGKCQGCVLCKISLCLFQHQIADCQGNTPSQAFENQPACWPCCRECCGIEHTAIEKDSPLGFR